MTNNPSDLTTADYLDGAREMHAAGRPYLAYLLAEEAAQRTADPATAAGIRAQFPAPTRKD
ncbi:hypothetical protein PV379_11150 [Streptomyces caniscabiei]|uniref:hypothetical protein n=1 Tax=Streptomyces caniscabiei TaxID=2746961 RepID=UPI0029A1310B|nr:hypothetical protein [Streptomyces caniscabiei]MDX2601654.1 hypothetical protein [Streptomyces caniscabiei]MDX2737089.1 hypothetical protein [Streptomyces caniscabiei]MDX2777865.1 hypothetical protein [Streptomyces caniscabiei]